MEEIDHQILELLHQGLNDAVVARQLGIGHRTVQRRVGNLMHHLGATGRVALGARAQELGLFTSGRNACNARADSV
ncbi:DNA-binding response regulator [Streptomyces sp. SID13726]|nr:DNA-binding response regulator [Streptomyces sp. SID13726]